MPEIKNTFTAGRLNKDLDERLVGQGEYRDALNVNVGTSESSDASSVENLKGNELIGQDFSNQLIETTTTTAGTAEIPAVPATPATATITGDLFDVVGYTQASGGSGGTAPNPTQTVTLDNTFYSQFPTVLPNIRVGQMFVTSAFAPGTTTLTVIRLTNTVNSGISVSNSSNSIQINYPVPVVGHQVSFVSDAGSIYSVSNLSSSQRYTITSVSYVGTNSVLSNGPHEVYSITLDRAMGSEVPTRSANSYASANHYSATGGLSYTITSGTFAGISIPTAEKFKHNDVIEFTDSNGFTFTVKVNTGDDANGIPIPITQGTVFNFTNASSSFLYGPGDTLTYKRLYEYANGNINSGNRFSSVVSTSPYVVQLSMHSDTFSVGDFYGYRRIQDLKDTVIPHVTAVNGNQLTLSSTPAHNSDDSGNGDYFGGGGLNTIVYRLRWTDGNNALTSSSPTTSASLVVAKSATGVWNTTTPIDPAVGEAIYKSGSTANITSVTSSGSNYTLELNNDLVSTPIVGDRLTINRTVITPGTDYVPAVPAVPATTTTVTSTVDAQAVTIGSIADKSASRIYWFITTPTYDGIYEYDTITNKVEPLIRGDLNFSVDNLITGINIIDGMLFWTDDRSEPRKLNIAKWKKANNTAIPTKIYSRAFINSDLTVIKPHPKGRLTTSSKVDAKKEILPFEEIFPQFGYRWKFSDGEYSPFSFFTEPVFEVDEYSTKEHYTEGYNKAVRNIVTEITVDNIPRGEEDVIEVEVLYTESISSTVYTLKRIKKIDFGTNPNYLNAQVFTKRSFYSALPSNQLSRHFDSIPTLAKSQEITANRLIYANYDFGFEQDTYANINVSQKEKSKTNGLSVKGARDYEVGVVYEDKAGRQGALLTGNGTNYTSKFSTAGTQQLQAKITSAAPSWATHFKHYVKDASSDHHNFPVYNTFNDGESGKLNSDFIWLQIDSNDRNKVSEDTFIIPRRHSHGEDGSTATNPLAFTVQNDRINLPHMHISSGSTSTNSKQRDQIIWAPGTNNGVDHYTGGGSDMYTNPEYIFTCAVAGKYTFEFEGELTWVSKTKRFRERNNKSGAMAAIASFQKANSGVNFGSITANNDQWEDVAKFEINAIHPYGNEEKDFSFYTAIEYELEVGDRVRPVIGKDYARGIGNFSMDLGFKFKTLSTPADPNAPAVPVDQFNFIVQDLSKHRIIEIENEAPDIVRSQLPVETQKLGNNVDVVAVEGAGNSQTKLVLTGGFEEAHDDNTTNDYDENSTVLYYEVGQNTSGYKRIPFVSALNQKLGAQNLGSLTIAEDFSLLQPAEYVNEVDVSELEGGLWFGIGPTGISTIGKSTANKIKIKEVALGYSNYMTDSARGTGPRARDILKIVLEEPVGINPTAQDFAIFKGNLTDNALKNIQGSFFAKVKRPTSGETRTMPFRSTLADRTIQIPAPGALKALPTGQSTFNDENEVTTLATIWFETLPEIADSNLNLYWEASKSIPIAEHGTAQSLDFYNCVALIKDKVFLETQRVFDKFNSVQMVKGIRVNVPQENYSKERRKAGLIFSGVYNSRTGINRLNEFVYSDGITKDLEPNYGSIQKLHTRDTNLVALCEDKVFTIMADKDILYSGAGTPQVIASNRVLGQTTPFIGDFGIGLDPSSFTSNANRMYFADRVRGKVVRISNDGISLISQAGMSDFFKDKLVSNVSKIKGGFDVNSGQYIISLDDYSLGFSEKQKGWVSRISYVPESSCSVNNIFYTFNQGSLYQHNSINVNRNNFYGVQYNSYLTTIFNQEPSVIKSFKTLNYEGTAGWTAPLMLTDQQAGSVLNFTNKEGKWFNNINGISNINITDEIDSLGGAGKAIDFYKEDNLSSLRQAGNINSEDTYYFSTDSNSSENQHLGVGPLNNITRVLGGPPSPVQGNSTITFNLQ